MLGRSIQGLGFGILQANLISFIKKIDPKKFSINMAICSQASELSTLFSPLLGVFFFEKINWNSPFWFISVVALFLMLKSKSIIINAETNNLKIIKDELLINQNHKLVSDYNFLTYNMVFVLMNSIGWGLISISPYLLENGVLGDWGHGIFYSIYTGIYMFGSYVFEKLEYFCKIKFQQYSISFMIMCGIFLLLFVMSKLTALFVVSMFIFGFLSGALYGFVFDKAQHNIHKENEETVRLATTTMLISRLVGSAVLTAFLAWTFKQNQNLTMVLSGLTIMGISYLLFLGKNEKYVKLLG